MDNIQNLVAEKLLMEDIGIQVEVVFKEMGFN